MKLIKIFILLFLVSFSRFTFADTYPSIWSCPTDYTLTSDPVPGACHANGNYNYWIYGSASCPGGGYLNWATCYDAPSCGSGEVRSSSTGICGMPPPHVCVYPEDPVKANCYFPEDQGEGVSCWDGSTVYPPMVCEPTPFDAHLPPTPGHPTDCMGGNVAVYPETCLDVYKMAIGVPPLDTLLGIVLGSKPMRIVGGAFDSLGNPVIRAAATIAKRSVDYEPPRWANVEYDVPHSAVGSALQKAFTAQPTAAFTNNFLNAVNAGKAASQQYIANVNTGQITRTGSTVPLTNNQLADMAVSANYLTPDNLATLTPYVDSAQSPWLTTGIAALSQDYQRVYNPAGFQTPIYFSGIPTGFGPSSSSIANTDPVAVFTPSSPMNYSFPSETPSTLPDSSVNQNPTGTDQTTALTPAPDPNTAIDPTVSELPPVPPTLYPDTWKYFDFLPMANPFMFDISKYLPKLPETTCYYEIHRTFHVPFLGEKHFDFAPCVPLQPLRAVLTWAFAVITGFACFLIIFRSSI